MQKVIKRDGRVVEFDANKVGEAIWKAAQAISGKDQETAQKIGAKVIERLEKKFSKDHYPTVEQVQDLVEKTLIEDGHAQTAKAYILYRHKRTESRRLQEKLLGSATKVPLSLTGLEVFEKEFHSSPEELFRNLAENFATSKKEEDKFYQILSELKFLPHPHILKNGHQKEACLFHEFIVPIKSNLLAQLSNAATLLSLGTSITINLQDTNKPASMLKLFQSTAELYGDKQNLAILPPSHSQKLSVLKLKNDEHSYFDILEENETTLPESCLPAEPYEPVALGWINLERVTTEELRDIAEIGTTFLKRVFEKSSYPLPKIQDQAEHKRYNLSLMGVAELLYEQKIPYQSYGAGVFIQNLLAKLEGRPVNLISNQIIAALFDTTDGIEPFSKQSHLEQIAIKQGFHSPRLLTAISKAKSFKPFEKEIPKEVREIVTTLKDLEKTFPREHRRLQKTLLHKAKKWVTT
jgi:hypothetical protein